MVQIRSSHHAAEDFTDAYHEYKDAIFRHCYFHTFQRERAQELMQEAFLKTWEYIAEGHDIDNVRAFLYRVATNLVYNDSRKKKETSLDKLQEEGFDPGTEDKALQRDVVAEEHVLAVLGKIEQPYRAALTMRYLEGLSPQEIADATGEPPNTVSVRISRGLKQLRSLLHHG